MFTVVRPCRKWAASGPERERRRRVLRWAKDGLERGPMGGFAVEKSRWGVRR